MTVMQGRFLSKVRKSRIGNTLLGKTNEAGELEIQSNTLLLGTHRFTAVKKDEDGHNVLTAVMSTVTVKKVDAPSADPNTTTVTFRLIGDTKHGEEGSDTEVGHAYSTWIATGVYSFDSDKVKAGDVCEGSAGEAGLTYEIGLENNYHSMIKAPVYVAAMNCGRRITAQIPAGCIP